MLLCSGMRQGNVKSMTGWGTCVLAHKPGKQCKSKKPGIQPLCKEVSGLLSCRADHNPRKPDPNLMSPYKAKEKMMFFGKREKISREYIAVAMTHGRPPLGDTEISRRPSFDRSVCKGVRVIRADTCASLSVVKSTKVIPKRGASSLSKSLIPFLCTAVLNNLNEAFLSIISTTTPDVQY